MNKNMKELRGASRTRRRIAVALMAAAAVSVVAVSAAWACTSSGVFKVVPNAGPDGTPVVATGKCFGTCVSAPSDQNLYEDTTASPPTILQKYVDNTVNPAPAPQPYCTSGDSAIGTRISTPLESQAVYTYKGALQKGSRQTGGLYIVCAGVAPGHLWDVVAIL